MSSVAVIAAVATQEPRPARGGRRPAVAPMSSVAAAVATQEPRRTTPSRTSSGRIPDPAVAITRVSPPAGRARQVPGVGIPTVTANARATVSPPTAGEPARSGARHDPPRSRRVWAPFAATETLELGVPPSIRDLGNYLAEDAANINTDLADCFHHVRDDHQMIKAVFAAAYEHDDERRQKGEIPASQPVFTTDRNELQQILEWIQQELTAMVNWLRRIQRTEAGIKRPATAVRGQPNQGARQRGRRSHAGGGRRVGCSGHQTIAEADVRFRPTLRRRTVRPGRSIPGVGVGGRPRARLLGLFAGGGQILR